MADREVWIVEWHDGSGKGTLAGYAFFSEAAGWRHVEQTRAEDDIRAKHGRARAWEGATWTVTRYIPAESAKAEAQPAGTGWVSVEERPLEDGETRIMAVQILRNGVPDWDIFIATPECGEWTDESSDPGWGMDEVTHSRALDLDGLPPLPPAPEPRR